MVRALEGIATAIDRREMSVGCSGGVHSGWTYAYVENDGPSHEEYQQQLKAYVAATRAEKETVPAPEASIVRAFERSPRRMQEAPAVPPGHFWRGVPESNRHQCRNCGEHYDKHLHTDEASTCPTANRGVNDER
jgi:hypothetical protein